MFSPTLLWGKSASDWKTMQVGRLLAGTSLMTRPRSRISPLVGRSMPTSMRIMVVLPLPDGPTSVKNRRQYVQINPGDGREVAELLDDLA